MYIQAYKIAQRCILMVIEVDNLETRENFAYAWRTELPGTRGS